MDAERINRSFERVLRHDRAITIALLIFIAVSSWAYILSVSYTHLTLPTKA